MVESLTLHWMILSQPARAVKHFLDISKVAHETKAWKIFEQEHRKDEAFMAISPLGTVPTLQHGDWGVSESGAIFNYLAANFDTSEQLLPKQDSKKRAHIEQWISWNQNTVRKAIMGLFFVIMKAFRTGEDIDVAAKEKEIANVKEVLGKVQEHISKTSGDFFLGEEYNLADIAIYTELTILHFISFDMSEFPQVAKFMEGINAIPEVQALEQEMKPHADGFLAGLKAKGLV
eukprot:NODE_3691_length_743_cov_23.948127_g3099_i0.p1 GENE.NODE_3691_length_743_cov_23.948127_g3099_i0~~NODE_3691_length_743_cov_23.948127_g3099_i0.p1  ORF type:complete len:232 (+),score=46.97 NODE_3691_length_743_cov_23.948127_g3099_i0:37-732(+)